MHDWKVTLHPHSPSSGDELGEVFILYSYTHGNILAFLFQNINN
jgi:hypothetical protein